VAAKKEEKRVFKIINTMGMINSYHVGKQSDDLTCKTKFSCPGEHQNVLIVVTQEAHCLACFSVRVIDDAIHCPQGHERLIARAVGHEEVQMVEVYVARVDLDDPCQHATCPAATDPGARAAKKKTFSKKE
jgi:hypothetical protein